MHKVLTYLLVMCLVGFMACKSGGDEAATTATNKTTTATTKPANQPAKKPTVNAQTKPTAQVNPAEQAKIDDAIIQKYLKDNNVKAEKDASGLYYIVEKAGSDEKPKLTDKVKVHYHGTLLDGTVFDSSVDRGEPISFGLNQVVRGWQIGIPKFGKGGKGRLILPSGLAYGTRRAGAKIGPNSCLIFDVELLDF